MKRILVIIVMMLVFFNINAFAKKTQEMPTVNRNPILNKFQNDKKVQQIICINSVENTNAIFKMYVRDKSQDTGWKLIVATDAFIGHRGLGKEKEGDLKTPVGEFNVTQAFGIKGNPGTTLDYINVTSEIYACDEDCQWYNQIINTDKTKHQCRGEHLIEYTPQYNYALCIDFNSKNVFPNGSNIFIHVKGERDYTAGCVAIDERSMISVVKNATKKTKVIIY